jgi:MYXO-CTERM domain-containing protein
MKHAFFALAGLIVMVASPALADVIRPEESACQARAAGDACTAVSGGICQADTCTRLDYEHWDMDASASPPSVSYDCLLCVNPTTGEVDSGPPTDVDAGTSGGGGGCSSAGAGSPGLFAIALAPLAVLALLRVTRRR